MMEFRSLYRVAILVALLHAFPMAPAWAQTVECGNAFYDDGEPVGWTWFGGNKAGNNKNMYAVRFDLADFGYEPGQVEIAGFCASNYIAAGGLYPNRVYVYPDVDGVPDDSVVLAEGTILTGNGAGESIVMFDEPVTLGGDFWLVSRGYAPYIQADFNIEYDAEADSGHSFVSTSGIENLTASTDGDWTLRAYLQAPNRRYLVGGVANASGAEGTQWRSNLGVLNVTEDTTVATLSYIRSDGVSTEEISLEPGQLAAWNDVAVELFGLDEDSAGSVRVDSGRRVVVSTRTYNQGDEGTFGQLLPGLSESEGITSGEVGVLSNLASNSQFRTNIGFINFGSKSCRVNISLFDAGGVQTGDVLPLSAPPSGWRQANDIFTSTGAGEHDHAYATVSLESPNCTVWAYASLIDRATGDPTTIPVVKK